MQISGNGLGYRTRKFLRRHRVAVGVATVLTLALLATSVLALRSAYVAGEQRQAAMAETARGTAVREYLVMLLRDAAAETPGGPGNARDALKQGAQQIFVQFEDRPQAGQDTALALSELYMQLGDWAAATPLLERLIAWPGIEQNPDVLANARYNLAQAEYTRGDAARARELLDAAQAWWNTQPQRFRVLRLESLITQAQIERAEGNVDQAVRTLERAVQGHRASPENNWRDTGVALNSLVLALGQAGRHEESIVVADEAYALFARHDALGSMFGLGTLNNRGTAYTFLGRFDLAVADFRQATTLRRELYGRSPELAALQVNLGMAMLKLAGPKGTDAYRAKVEETIPLLEDAYAMSLELSGETSRTTVVSRVNLIETYAAGGRGAQAEALAADAVRIASEQFGADSMFAAISLRARANAHAAQGRKAEALQDFDAALAIFTALGKGGEIYLPAVQASRSLLLDE